MLKLERTTHIGISVRFREKDPIFNKEMLLATGLALLFHIVMIGLFTIASFHQDSIFIFSPIQVHLENPALNVASFIKDSEDETKFLPSYDLIELTGSKELVHQQFLNYINSINDIPNLDLLDSIEERIWPMWKPGLTISLKTPTIQINLFGEISRYSYSSPYLSLNDSPPISGPLSIYYEVKIDSKTGKIFWFESEKSISDKLAYFLEKILKDLKFEINDSSIILNGQINFTVL